jgi:hypothetical protein
MPGCKRCQWTQFLAIATHFVVAKSGLESTGDRAYRGGGHEGVERGLAFSFSLQETDWPERKSCIKPGVVP